MANLAAELEIVDNSGNNSQDRDKAAGVSKERDKQNWRMLSEIAPLRQEFFPRLYAAN